MKRPTLTSVSRELSYIFAREGWMWSTKGGRIVSPYVPGTSQIRRLIESTIKSLRENPAVEAEETGRIRVERRLNEHGETAGFEVLLIAERYRL